MAENQDTESICLPTPGDSADDGVDFLESLAAGNIGAGIKMTSQGSTIPTVRTEYKRLIEQFESQLQVKMRSGLPSEEIARWAVNERTRIARLMRSRQGIGSKVILELRDVQKYGAGGRSYDNLAKRALEKGANEVDIPEHLLRNATKPNKAISDAAVKGAKFLKHGGKAVVVISVSMTAYTLLTAPPDKLERIIYQEIGAAAGGFLAGGAGVGLCLVFGIATSGWGLLACGVVGGGVGGYAGSKVGDKVFLLQSDHPVSTATIAGGGFQQIDHRALLEDIEQLENAPAQYNSSAPDISLMPSTWGERFDRPSLTHRKPTQYPICSEP